MRGIPLASLTPSSVMRGFYVTKDDDGLWATWTESPKITYSPVEQTETTPSFDFSTTDEVATVSYSQSELKSSVLDNQPNDTVNQEEDANEINVTTLGSSATSSEDLNHEEPKVTTSFVEEGSMSKRGKSLHDFTRGSTSLPNIPVVSPTTPTRRAIALAVSRYNEFTTPLWTGRRIVAKKRIRTTVSPIRDAIRRIESDSVRNVASPSKTVSPAISSTPIATKRRFPLTPTVPTTPIIASERAILPETVNNPTNAANGETKDPKNHVTTEAAMTLTTDSSTAESEPSIATISVDFVEDLASRVTNELGISTTPGSTDVTDDTSTVATQSPVIYDSTIFEDDVKDESTLTTANYMAAADPTTASENPASTSTNYFADASLMSTSTHAIIIVDSANTGLEIVTSAIVDHPEITVTTDTPVNMATDPVIKSYTTTTAIPETTNTYDTMTDPEPTTTVKVATIEVEAASTSGDRPANTILTTVEEERLTTPEIITSTMMPTEIESTTKSFTTDTMTTLTTTIGPATTDYLKTITESANTNEPPSTDTPMIADDVSTTTINPESIFETLSDLPNTDPASTVTEFSTTPFVAPTGHNISDDMEAPNATEIAESTTEIPTTSETFPTLAIAITTPKSFVSTDPETSTAATTAFSTQTYETSTTPMVTRTSSSFLPVASTVEIKDSSSIPETSRESVATNTILQATTARTISEGFTRSKLRKQSPTTVSEVVTMRAMQNRTRGRTRSELAAIGHEFGRRTSGKTVVHRRVINQPSDGDVEISTTRQPVRQYPRRRVTVYRGESRRPSYNHPSSRVVEQNQRRRIVQKRLRTSSEATIARSDESVTDDVRNITEEHISRDRVENAGRRTRVVLKKVKQRAEEGERSAIPAEETLVLGESSNLPNNEAFQSHREDKKLGRRRKVVVKRIKPQAEEKARTNNTDSSDRHPPGESQSDLTETDKLKKRTRVVLKRLKPITEDRNSTIRGASIDSDSGNENLTQTLPSNLRAGNGLPNEGNARRRTRVVLKSIKPISQEKKATEEVSTKLGATNKNLFNERTSRRMRVVLKSVRPKLEREGAAIEEQEEASDDPDSTGDDLQGNYSNNLYVSDDPPDEKKSTRSKPEEEEEEEATTRSEQLAEPRGTETTSVRVEEDTDQPSHEVNTWKIDVSEPIGRVPTIRRPHRQRTPTTTHSTTQVPLTNSLPNVASTVQRRSRPFTEATLSSRIDLVDPYEVTESPYVRSTEVDQRAELSDQSIRAQEFAVTLADPPSSSSSGTGRTPLRDAARRKISTTISPRTEPTLTSRTISRYDDISNNGVSRSRQGSRTKDRPTVNATTRPRRPPIVDYDYYEDEVPIIAGKSSLLNSKLFLTSKGTIRCLDQGNFPHPYSCRKFITCARMVNGQVIGTEYTCPAKLSFDPIGGICNWSAGLGCKD